MSEATPEHDEEMREFVRDLFADPEQSTPPAEMPRRTNVVPKEGRNPQVQSDPNAEFRAFVRDVFDNPA